MPPVAAPDPINIYEGQDFYVPSFKILIKDQDLHVENDILSVSYTDSLTEVDSFQMTVNNWDPGWASPQDGISSQGSFKYSDADTFNPWQDIEVWMGYYRNGSDERRLMLTGEITTMAPNFPGTGGPTLTVSGLNVLHRFRIKQNTLPFLDKKDTQIAKTLVEGIDKDIRGKIQKMRLMMDDKEVAKNLENEENVPYLEMHNDYPINFLLQRSRAIGYEISIEEKPRKSVSDPRVSIFHYRKTSEVVRPTYILEWGKSLLSFQPTLQTSHQVQEVTVRGWDPQGKTKIEQTATRADLAKEKNGVIQPSDLKVKETSLAQKLEIVVDHPISNKDEAKQLATKTLRNLAQGLVTAKGKTFGLPSLRAGSKVDVRGLGTRFSGTYLVTGTTHSIGDGGYTTEFSARMEARLEPSK